MCTSGSPEDELDLVKEPHGALEVGTLKCADWIAMFETSLCSNPFYSNSSESSYGQHKHCKKLLQTNRETSRRTSDRQADIEAHDLLDPKVAKQQMHDCGQSWEGVEVGQEEGGGETGPQQSDQIWAGQPNPSKKYGRNPPTPQNASPLCPLCSICSIPHPPPVTANVQSINRDTACKTVSWKV